MLDLGSLPWFLFFSGAHAGAAIKVVVHFGQLELLLGVGNDGLLHVAHDLARDQKGRQQLCKQTGNV